MTPGPPSPQPPKERSYRGFPKREAEEEGAINFAKKREQKQGEGKAAIKNAQMEKAGVGVIFGLDFFPPCEG